MEIKKGNKYSCRRDVIMKDGTNRRAFTKGNTYVSENNQCLTDDNGNKEHYIVNTNEPPRFVVGEHFMWVGRVSEERSISANAENRIAVLLTKNELGLIQDALEAAYDAVMKSHGRLARLTSPVVMSELLTSADKFKHLGDKLRSPDDVGLDLATALKDLMAAEGGEPGDTLVGKTAWKQARMVLEFYGYE